LQNYQPEVEDEGDEDKADTIAATTSTKQCYQQ